MSSQPMFVDNESDEENNEESDDEVDIRQPKRLRQLVSPINILHCHDHNHGNINL